MIHSLHFEYTAITIVAEGVGSKYMTLEIGCLDVFQPSVFVESFYFCHTSTSLSSPFSNLPFLLHDGRSA